MNTKKRLISCFLILVLVISMLPISASAKKDLTKVLAEAKQGVVQLYVRGPLGLASVGTGFGVGKAGKDTNVFVTNWHVVTVKGVFDPADVEVWILKENCKVDSNGYPDSSRSIKCEILKTTSGYPDYAIIRATTDVKGYKALPLMSSKQIDDGTSVYALGFPSEVSSLSSHNYGVDDITSTDGIVSQHLQMEDLGSTWTLMHTAQISSGNSGGPLINSDGAVVGVNTYTVSTKGSTTGSRYMSIYTDYVMDGLIDLGIPFDTYPLGLINRLFGINTASGGSTVAIVCAALVLLAVIVVIVLLIIKKQKEEQERQAAEQRRVLEEQRRREEAKRQDEERRRKEKALQEKKALEERAHVRCWDGRVVAVGAGATIGRDPKCTIALPESAPGVSRTHCRLEMQGSQLVLTDLGSSYGTLIHGKRIPANTPVALKVGSTFCLASDKYCFTVC